MNLLQALSNSRTDAYGDLYREGTASLLNSMVSRSFTYTTNQVRDRFVSALSSDKSAAAQAQLFKLANEGQAWAEVLISFQNRHFQFLAMSSFIVYVYHVCLLKIEYE